MVRVLAVLPMRHEVAFDLALMHLHWTVGIGHASCFRLLRHWLGLAASESKLAAAAHDKFWKWHR